jgi:hypothetical protein
MMVPPRERGQLLILLAGWLFFGGGASSALIVYDRPASEMKKVIKRVIPDADRRDAILSDLSRWKSGQKKQDKEASSDRKELFKTLRRKDAERSDAEPIMAKLDETFLKMDRNFLDLRFRVKEQVSSAEWAEIVARPNGQ